MRSEGQAGELWTRRLVGPVIAAAALRLALLALLLARSGASALERPDTHTYLEPGRNLLLHGSFTAAGLPEILRTPGYPLFLAMTSLAGPIAVALAQVVLSVLSVVLVWRLALQISPDTRIALLAAWLFALEPLSVTYSILLLPETLFLALFLLSLERLAAFLRSRQLNVLAAAGLCLAAATFVRPVTFYLPLLLAAGLLVAFARSPGLRWKAPAVLLLTVMPCLAAWQIRNRIETGFSGFSAVQALNLYFYSSAEVVARLEHHSLEQVQDELGYNSELLFLMRHPDAAAWTQLQRIGFMQAEALRVIRNHPALFLRLHLAGSLRTAFNPGAAVLLSLFNLASADESFAREHNQGPLRAAQWTVLHAPLQAAYMAALSILLLGLYFFAARGVLRGSASAPALALLLGVSLYFLAVSGGAAGIARLRLPMMPALCVMAAAGIVRRSAIPQHRASSLPLPR